MTLLWRRLVVTSALVGVPLAGACRLDTSNVPCNSTSACPTGTTCQAGFCRPGAADSLRSGDGPGDSPLSDGAAPDRSNAMRPDGAPDRAFAVDARLGDRLTRIDSLIPPDHNLPRPDSRPPPGDASMVSFPYRLVGPLPSSIARSPIVTLSWTPPTASASVYLQTCGDSRCATAVTAWGPIAGGSSSFPLPAIMPGVQFWRLLDGSTGLPLSASWELWGRRANSTYGGSSAWGTVLDVNADGCPDLGVGAPGANEAMVYLNNGTSAHPCSGPGGSSQFVATVTLNGDAVATSQFGTSVAAAGDVNGDGYTDFLVGAPGEGAAYVYFGGAAGISPSRWQKVTGGSGFGSSVAEIGDLNVDGYADVVIGSGGTGAAYVYLGSPTGLSTAPPTVLSDSALPRAGAVVLGLGDVNGDGLGDVAVGDAPESSGEVFLTSAGKLALTTINGDCCGGGTTCGVGWIGTAAGDVNNDGYADYMYGIPGTGTVFVDLGASSAPFSKGTYWGLTGLTAVAGAGDANGDGYDDVLTEDRSNLVHYYKGANGGAATTPSQTLTFSNQVALAGHGDLTLDGTDDVLIGDPVGLRLLIAAGSATGPGAAIAVAVGAAGSMFGASVY